MADETIGTARIDIIVDADQARAEIAKSKNLVSGMGPEFEKSFSKMTAAQQRATLSALKYTQQVGKSGEAIKQLNLIARGAAPEAVAKLGQAFEAERAKQENATRAVKQHADAVQEAARRNVAAAAEQQAAAKRAQAAMTAMMQEGTLRAKMRSDASFAFGPLLDEQERSNGVRDRLTAFLATERGQRIQAAEWLRNPSEAIAQTAAKTAGAVGLTTKAFAGSSKTARELQFSMRGLPAQFTDIFTSLASGQRPMMVLLQQGGQIKDMFGGIRPALSAVGRGLMAMINPWTLAAVVVGTFVTALVKGQNEVFAFNNALAKTNGFAGLTTQQLEAMASNMDAMSGTTRGAAASILAALTATGKFSGDSVRPAAEAANAMQKLGMSAKDAVQELSAFADDPVQELIKLQAVTHDVSAADIQRIQQLKDLGQEHQAVTEALKIRANVAKEVLANTQDNVNILGKAWRFVKSAAGEAWDIMTGVGILTAHETTPLERAQAQLQAMLQTYAAVSRAATEAGARVDQSGLQQRIAAQSGMIGAMMRAGESEAQQAAIRAAESRAQQTLTAAQQQQRSMRSQADKLKDEIKRMQVEQGLTFGAFIAAGNGAAAQQTRSTYAGIIKGLRDQLSKLGDKSAKSSREPNDSLAGVVQSLALTADKSTGPVDKFWASINRLQSAYDASEKRGISVVQLQKEYAQGVDLATGALAKQQQQLATKNAAALKEYTDALSDQIALQEVASRQRIEAVGQGQQEAQRRQELTRIEQEYNDRLRKLQTAKAIAPEGRQQQIQAQIDAQKAAMDAELQVTIKAYRGMDEARADYMNGVRGAWMDFGVQATNLADQTRSAFGGLLDGVANNFAELAVSGKASFGDLAKSFAKELNAMTIKFLMFRAITGVMSFFSGPAAGAASASTSAIGQSFSFSNPSLFAAPAFAGGGIVPGSGPTDSVMARVTPGEGVFTPGQMARLAPVGSATGDVTVNVINQGGQPLAVSRTQKTRGPNGMQTITVMVKSALQNMASTGQLEHVLAPYGVARTGQR